jgi:predicted ribosome quality control (RQC) complex YloA/Tae2 family protein
MVKQDNTYPNNLIVIGETAEENTEIISKAKQTDVWFHLANLPSCHVIISCDKKNPLTKQMILFNGKLNYLNTIGDH